MVQYIAGGSIACKGLERERPRLDELAAAELSLVSEPRHDSFMRWLGSPLRIDGYRAQQDGDPEPEKGRGGE